MVFNRYRREGKENWKWEGNRIEEVQSFKYLGFTFTIIGREVIQNIKELCRKEKMAARRIWGLDKRICKDDFIRRWILFKYLIQSIMSYRIEIWG